MAEPPVQRCNDDELDRLIEKADVVGIDSSGGNTTVARAIMGRSIHRDMPQPV